MPTATATDGATASATAIATDPAAARDIVLCCDGTDNTLTAGRADTHVLRMYQHLRRHPATTPRIMFYDPGVGAPAGAPATGPGDYLARSIERISGLASGRGIYANITDAYLFIARHYRASSDRIWLFGFSRGAFTVRCVAGMVNLFGIIGAEHEAMLPTLIRIYFSLPDDPAADRGRPFRSLMRSVDNLFGGEKAPGRTALAKQVRDEFTAAPGRDAWVHFVGVWDTVESVGLPGPLSRSNPSTATVHDKRFHHVRHALSLDEHRWAFEPRLYEEPGDVDDPALPQTLRQRWFPGAHRDVGGGYTPERAGLADATLRWMIAEAVGCGLAVPLLKAASVRATAHDELWQTPAWALAGMCLRDLQPKTAQGAPIEVIAGPPAGPPVISMWARRRHPAPLLLALVLGVACLQRLGASLKGDGWRTLWRPEAWSEEADVTGRFVVEQVQGPWQRGLALVQTHGAAEVVWAMAWDFAFIACWGSLLARIASRSFAWLAGLRAPGMRLPPWRFLGFMPFLAVAGDAVENLSTVAAFAAQGAGLSGWAAWSMLAVCSLASLLKWAGLIGCIPLLLVRLWMTLPGVRPV